MRCLTDYVIRFLTCLLLGGVLLSTADLRAQGDNVAPIYIDDSPAAMDLLHEANHLREQERFTEAAAKYQTVLERHAYKLIGTGDGLFVDIHTHVCNELLQDETTLNAYRDLNEPIAARAMSKLPRGLEREHSLRDIASLYPMTTTGLEAALQLAGMRIERAAPMDAISVLHRAQRNPDLKSQSVRFHRLYATASLFAGRTDAFNKTIALLEDEGAGEVAAHLRELSSSLALPEQVTLLEGSQQLPGVQLPDSLTTELWKVRFDTYENSIVPRQSRMSNSQLGGNRSGSPHYLLSASLVDDAIYTTDGSTLQAIDRYTGRVRWVHAPRDVELHKTLGNSAPISQWVDEVRGVAVGENRLFTIIGRVSSTQYGWRMRNQKTNLTCLHPKDGRVIWSVAPSDLDESMNVAFFHGTPILSQGRIYIMVRRNQTSGFNSAFVFAIDASDGSLVWRRHLSSAAVMRGVSLQSLGQMILSDHRLYVADSLGAVACIDAQNGGIYWLNMLSNTLSSKQLISSRKRLKEVYQPHAPVLSKAGLVVPPFEPTSPTLLLDPETGGLLRALNPKIWDGVDQCIMTDQGLLAIGENVCLLDHHSLERKWTAPAGGTSDYADAARGVVTKQVVLIPQKAHVRILSLEDGKHVGDVPISGTGSLLALDNQLISFDDEIIRSFAERDFAFAAANRRLKEDETDPLPGLELAHLAALYQRWDTLLAGLDSSIRAIERLRAEAGITLGSTPNGEVMQEIDRVFRQIRIMADPESLSDTDQRFPLYVPILQTDLSFREALFDRLSSVSATPTHEVTYHISVGHYLEDVDKPSDALEHYQAVLSDPTLASQLYQHREGSRQAQLEARILIKKLVPENPGIYKQFELLAVDMLETLREDPSADANAFVDLALRYPIAKAAPAALYTAAERLIDRGEDRRAVALLLRSLSEAKEEQLRSDNMVQLAQTYQRLNQPRRAARWLARLQQETQKETVTFKGETVEVETWLLRLKVMQAQQGQVPSIALPLKVPHVLPGRLLMPTDQPKDTWPEDVVLSQISQTVQCHDPADLSAMWRVATPAEDTRLLATSNSQALLFSESVGTLLCVDLNTGEPAWPQVDVVGILRSVDTDQQANTDAPNMQKQFERILNPGDFQEILRRHRNRFDPQMVQDETQKMLVAMNDQVLCMADRSGRAVAISRQTGRVLWQESFDFRELINVEMDDRVLMFGGNAGLPNDTQNGEAILVDPLTGQTEASMVSDRNTVNWVGLGGDDLLIFSTPDHVSAHRLATRRLAWQLPMKGSKYPVFGMADAEHVMVQDAAEALQIIDAVEGRVIKTIVALERDSMRRPNILNVDDKWYIASPWHSVAIDNSGQLLWRDAITSVEKSIIAQVVTEKHIVLLAHGPQPMLSQPQEVLRGLQILDGPMPGQAAEQIELPRRVEESFHYRLFILDRETGRLMDERLIGPLGERLFGRTLMALNNRILLTTESRTIVIPTSEAE